MNIKSIIKIISVSVLAFASVFSVALADFDPGHLIDDKVFTDTQTFGGAAGIQQFLTLKGSLLANTSPAFLSQLKEPQDPKIKQALSDPEPNLPRLRSAAELIWDASTQAGINPQVILVTLQKEQGLITNTPSDIQRALDHALGFSCPDSGCSSLFSGFYFQLFGTLDAQGNRYIGAPASFARSFNTPNGRGPAVDAQNTTFGSPAVRTSHVGDTITVDNTQGPPNNAPATQTFVLSDLATAALYRYTPHVYNGNYNFWKFFNSWFKYPNGTLFHINGGAETYIINNGARSLLLNFVMMSRGLNPQTANIITLSQSESDNYDAGAAYPPPDNVIVFLNSDAAHTLYVFEGGIKHPVSSFVLNQRGLNAANAISVAQNEFDAFPTGELLAPKDGTLIRGDASPTVYITQNGKKMILTGLTFGQFGYSFKNVITLPQSEVDSYASGGYVLPKNGTLVFLDKGREVYELADQILHPVSYAVFQLNKFSFKNVVTVSAEEVGNAGIGVFMPPPEGTYFQMQTTGAYYYYKNGSKHSISPFVLKQRNIIKTAAALSFEEGIDLPDGAPLPPKDGTLIKGDSSGAIYAIVNGQKTLLDYATWVKKYRKQAPQILPQTEVDSYVSAGSE